MCYILLKGIYKQVREFYTFQDLWPFSIYSYLLGFVRPSLENKMGKADDGEE